MVGATVSMIIARFRAAAAAIKQRWWRANSDRGQPHLGFWLSLARQTFGGRELAPLSRELADAYQATGLENLPNEGVFTLAVNHTMRRWTPRLLATVHQATLEKRPDLEREW